MMKDAQIVADRSLPIYALTGANGHLGRLVLTYLLDQVPAMQILATTRRPERLADFSAKGVVVRMADFDDPASLPAAFSGATRLLIISSNAYPMDKRAAQQRSAIAAAVKAGVRHITSTCIANAANQDDENPWTHGTRQTLEALARSGAAWTALGMNIWMAGIAYFLSTLHVGGQVLIPEGSGKPCWVTHEDYARTAVSVLTSKACMDGVVEVTGPESLGLTDLAQRWSNIHGCQLEVQIIPANQVIDKLTAHGMPLPSAQGIVDYCGMLRLFELPPSDTVERATGIPSISVDGLLRDLVLA